MGRGAVVGVVAIPTSLLLPGVPLSDSCKFEVWVGPTIFFINEPQNCFM